MKEEKKIIKKTAGNELIFGMEAWKIKALIPVAICLVLVIVSIGILIVPKIDQINDYKKMSLDLSGKSKDIEQKINYLKSADESIIKQREENLLMAMPGSKDIYFLLNVITDLTRDYGFNVTSFAFSPGNIENDEEDRKAEVEKMSFDLSLIGPADRYIDLVDGIENSLPIMSISDIDSKTTSMSLMEIKLNLVTYFAVGRNKVDVSKLTYKDLVISENELKLSERISSFRKIEGLTISDSELGSGQEYIEYTPRNPFGGIN